MARRKLKVDFFLLERAFEDASGMMDCYLDLETGDVIMLGDWDDDTPVDAEAIEQDYEGIRYVRVPSSDSHEAYQDMEEFILTVKDSHLRELLDVAIRGKGAFGRFKGVLLDYPEERQRWFTYKQDRLHKRIRLWLKSNEIEPIVED